MRKLLRKMAKAEMKRRGSAHINRQMAVGRWREFVGAYPTNIITGKKMAKNYHGNKRFKPGHWEHLFSYSY